MLCRFIVDFLICISKILDVSLYETTTRPLQIYRLIRIDFILKLLNVLYETGVSLQPVGWRSRTRRRAGASDGYIFL